MVENIDIAKNILFFYTYCNMIIHHKIASVKGTFLIEENGCGLAEISFSTRDDGIPTIIYTEVN